MLECQAPVITQTGDFSLVPCAHGCSTPQEQPDQFRLPFGAGLFKDVFEMGLGRVARHVQRLSHLLYLFSVKQERGDTGLGAAQTEHPAEEVPIGLFSGFRIVHEYGARRTRFWK